MRHDLANELQHTLVVVAAAFVASAAAAVVVVVIAAGRVRNLHNFIAHILGAGIMSLDILFQFMKLLFYAICL